MSLLFWKRYEDVDDRPDRDVSEQWPLPVQQSWREEESFDWEEISKTHPLPVQVTGTSGGAQLIGTTTQVAVPITTSGLIYPANPRRSSLVITNITGTQILYIGFSSALTATNGQYVHSAAGSNITIYNQGAIYGISITGAQTVSILEEYYVG